MKISARNILKGTVVAVAEGVVNGVVSIKVGDDVVKADITMEAIKSLGLAEGVEAFAIVKASSVMFAAGSEKIAGISARNQIAGTVVEVTEGAVNGHVAIKSLGRAHQRVHHERGHRGARSCAGRSRHRRCEVNRCHGGRRVAFAEIR